MCEYVKLCCEQLDTSLNCFIFFKGGMKEKMRKDSLGSDTSSNADKKLQNQFSFVERATQTMNNSLKVQKNMIFLLLRLKQSFIN